jgi:hypothetical protein
MDKLRGKTGNSYKSHCIESTEGNPMDQNLSTFHFSYYISPLAQQSVFGADNC